MLKFNTRIIFLLTLLLACKLAINSAVVAMHGTIYGPESYDDIEYDIAPQAVADDTITLSSAPEELYERCVMMIGEDCGNEIFDLIFRNDTSILTGKEMKELVSKHCCGKLLDMGRDCHDEMVNAIVKTPPFSTNSSVTVPRSYQVWDLCSLSSY